MEVQPEAPDKHISKRAKLQSLFADVMKTPDPIQSSVNLLTTRPEDPIVWNLRLLVVENLSIDYEKELDLVGELVEDDAKNCLKWRYRRCIAEKIGVAAAHKEREFAAKFLSKHPTNYLAWSHREWVLRALGGRLKDELDYCQEILEKDPFNSFAWNQRWTLITEHCPEGDLKTMKLVETNKAMSAIEDKPENNCPWAYLRRLHKKDDMKSFFQLAVSVQNVVLNLVDRAKDLSEGTDLDLLCLNKIGCMHALKLIFELLNHGYQPTTGMKDVIQVLYPKYGPSGLGHADKVRVIMESLDYHGIFGLLE